MDPLAGQAEFEPWPHCNVVKAEDSFGCCPSKVARPDLSTFGRYATPLPGGGGFRVRLESRV